MLKVLTAAQMREVDRLTTERYGIPSILLMENAAHAVARVITEKLGGSVKGKSILILCGPGNNGGDGAALARILWQAGAVVNVILLGEVAKIHGDAKVNLDVLVKIEKECLNAQGFNNNIYFFEGRDLGDDFSQVLFELSGEGSLVVDAMLGTGVTRPLAACFAECAEQLNAKHITVISVDIPSGLPSDEQGVDVISVHAETTVTFTAPKPGNVLPPAAERNGTLVVANIGTPVELIKAQPSQTFLAEENDPIIWLRRSEFINASYKNKRGHALIIGGSSDYSGAAVLCGDAAIRSGCGLVTVATPESSRESIVARVSPEVMVRGIPETESGSAAANAADEIGDFLKNADAVAIGSGLSSQEDETKAFVRRVVEERRTPVVVDADGLTALSPWGVNGPAVADDNGGAGESPAFQSDELAALRSLPLILTPHEGEFKRLLGVEGDEANEVLKDRVQAVRDFATRFNVILVLKGERALIAAPDGRVVVNPTGNSGLGKAGNGDTLTGIITGFVAQATQMNIDIFETVVAAVYIAGMAGDVAEKKYGKRVMTASDVRDCLVEVFEELSKD